MIYIVRHGETQGNVAGVLRGSVYDDELTERGHQQARDAARELAGVKFDAVYCSPMKRTRQTCEAIYKGPVNMEERILPRKYAGVVGMSAAEAEELGLWKRSSSVKIDGLETVSEIETRVWQFLDDIKAKHKGENILVVTHGSVCRFVCSYMDGAAVDDSSASVVLPNCGILRIEN